jgi:ssDNA-binding Zn-finger/Zn-ribbon topoisomerase 1
MEQLVGPLLAYGIAALIIGLLAARKNRSGWGWGLIGGLFLIPGLLVLMFMSYLCPKCRQSITNAEWKTRTCPRCGNVAHVEKAQSGA